MSTTRSTLLTAAQDYRERGWVAHPLGLDKDGYAKRPLLKHWSNLTLAQWDSLSQRREWEWASGLGIVLGPASDNLAVIDVDDCELAAAVFAHLVRQHIRCRMVWTVRKRIHIYVHEEKPSKSTAFTVIYDGREVTTELKGRGTQVAAPPSPGYVLAHDWPPWPQPTIASAWKALADALGVEYAQPQTDKGNGMVPDAVLGEPIPQGTRRPTLMRVGGYLHNRLSLEWTAAILHAINRANCQPVLPPEEIDHLVQSLQRYPQRYIKEEGDGEGDLLREVLE